MSNFDLGSLMKNAKKMQEMLQQQQEELAKTEVTGEAGAGSVSITMNGKLQVLKVHFDPEILKEDPEVVEDLTLAAMNKALGMIEKINKEKMMDASKLLG